MEYYKINIKLNNIEYILTFTSIIVIIAIRKLIRPLVPRQNERFESGPVTANKDGNDETNDCTHEK
jgi:hypothetical protein